jgi:hypothetical protein
VIPVLILTKYVRICLNILRHRAAHVHGAVGV